ncbi:21839_t:CDS:2, partial [Racocetra persica]
MDELFGLRNLFYTGSFQQVINEGSSRTSVSDSAKLERKIYLYRAYVAQGKHNIVITEIKDSDPIDLRVVKILAVYLQSKSGSQASETKKEETLKELKEILSDAANVSNSTVQVIA